MGSFPMKAADKIQVASYYHYPLILLWKKKWTSLQVNSGHVVSAPIALLCSERRPSLLQPSPALTGSWEEHSSASSLVTYAAISGQCLWARNSAPVQQSLHLLVSQAFPSMHAWQMLQYPSFSNTQEANTDHPFPALQIPDQLAALWGGIWIQGLHLCG